MFKSKSSIVLLAFLLINFCQLFLYKQVLNCSIAKYTLWINANILYLISVSGIFSRYWSTGALEQLVTFTSNVRGFITKSILSLWVSRGIPLTLLATALYYSLDTDPTHIFDLALFATSLCYSTAIFSFSGALCSSVTVAADRITPIILAAPISTPGIIAAAALLKGDIPNPFLLMSLLIGNVLIASLSPLIMETALKETLENL